ncbi:MAG: class I SAM-dependent methyltransferase [Arenimonas sp.]
MSIQTAYDNWSSTYDLDRNLTRDLDQMIMRSILAHRKFKNTLELGCGTGKNTALLSEVSETVLALDFSEGMIEQARQKVGAANVDFQVADLTKDWPNQNEVYDLVACNLVLEHIEDLSCVFKEVYRSLCKGGVFHVSELHPFRQYQGGKAHFLRDGLVNEVQAYVHHVSDFLRAATENGLSLQVFNEYSHPDDEGKPPRLAVFMFQKE